MKQDLLDLINQIEEIRTHFSDGGDSRGSTRIFNNSEFTIWKSGLQLYLQDIFDVSKDDFIGHTLIIIKKGFKGLHDVRKFNELTGNLIAIKNNINKYYPNEVVQITIMEEKIVEKKQPKIFISHSSEDAAYMEILVKLLNVIGVQKQHIICSSVPNCNVPSGNDIYRYLREQFENPNLFVIFAISKKYYESVPCLNEMGAAWMVGSKCEIILLPHFKIEHMKGVINKNQMAIKLYSDDKLLKKGLGDLKRNIFEKFTDLKIEDTDWEDARNEFIKEVKGIYDTKQDSPQLNNVSTGAEFLYPDENRYYYAEIVECRECPKPEYRIYKLNKLIYSNTAPEPNETHWLFYDSKNYKDLVKGDKVKFKHGNITDLKNYGDGLDSARNVYLKELSVLSASNEYIGHTK